MSDKITDSGFEATIQACKALGLDLSAVPMSVLQIFYNSGMSFADHPGAFTPEQRQAWRNSVIWPKHKEAREPDSSPPKLPPIIENRPPFGEKRKPGRPRKILV
jgi:hypothetical protein